jgi:hypothetical protein
MRHSKLGFALATTIYLLSGNLAAQTAPGAAQTQVTPPPDADEAPRVTPPSVTAPGAPSAPDWTFEEVLGGEVTVGQELSPVALGVGALAGVVAFNVLAQYVFPNTDLLTQTFLAETDLAASRIYAVGSAVAGALAGQYIYEQTTDTP